MAGKSSKGAKRLLDLRGQVWWFKRAIPSDCSQALGKKTILRSLETSDIRIAQARRDEVELETVRLFADIRSGKYVAGGGLSPADRGALWRETLRGLEEGPETDPELLYDARNAEEDERESLRGADKEAYETALLGRVPVDEHLEAYLAVAKLAPKTRKARRGLVKHFARWCVEEKLTLDQINRRTAVLADDDPPAMGRMDFLGGEPKDAVQANLRRF